MSRSYLLDTSAILALIEEEAGADRVEELLRSDQPILIPFVAGLEVYYITLQERSRDEADRRLALLRQLPSVWLDQVSDTALIQAGIFKANHRLSFADALIAAYAANTGAALVHKDPEYRSLRNLIEQEELPLKNKDTPSSG